MSKYDIWPDFECQKTKSRKRKANNEKRITKSEKRIMKKEKRKTKSEKRITKSKKRKTNQLHLALIEVFMKRVGTVNVLKDRTLIYFYFSVVRNFRNYVSEKVLVFEILECGLYHEKKGIYACQNVVETY